MGAGNQGGGGNAEDAAIRRDATARGEDPSVTRRYFADRDSGKLAARSYLDSRPTDRTMSDGSPMDDTFAENIDSKLGNIGVTRNDTSFVNADGKTVGGINRAGNFFGGREVLDALRGTPSLTDMRRAASREVKYGPGSRAAQEGDVNTSLLDLVDYAEDGTVQGMGPNRFMDERGRGQLVYDPSAVIPGLPYLQDPQNDVFVPQYDPSRESLLGRGLQRGVDFIGQGGMMGAVTRGLGALSDDLGGGDKSSNLSDEVTSSGITNALMSGVNSVSNNPLTGFEPQVAGPFSASAINPFINMNIDPTRMSQQGPNFTPPPVQFDASGKTVEERLLEAQKDRFGAVDDLSMDRLRTMRLRDKLNEAYDPNFYDAFGNEYNNAETARISDVINEADSQAAMQRQTQINSLGQRVPITDKPFYDMSASEAASLDDANLGYLQDRYVPEIVTQENINPVTAGFSGFNMGSPEVSSFRPTFDVENQQRAAREASFGGADQSLAPYGGQEFAFLDRDRPSFPAPERTPYGGLSLEGFSEFDALSPSSVSNMVQNPDGSASTGLDGPVLEKVITDARAKRRAKLNTSDNTMFGTDDLRDPVETIYDDADQLEDLMTTGAIDPSAANIGVGGGDGGGGGGPVQCPPGYEPMILESGETVCVPITEDEEVMDEGEVITAPPVTRPTISDSPYTPQAVSNIAPYRLQPGSSGGGLADILQLQNYPTIV